MKKAIVLLSGGLDSGTTLYLAKSKKIKCFCLIFDYGQRHRKEINSALSLARKTKSDYLVLNIKLPWKGSSLLDNKVKIPLRGKGSKGQRVKGVPNTYVPGRNILFLSYALSYAEAIGARDIFIGANAIDFSGYPDCRPGFIKEFYKLSIVGTKAGSEGNPIKINAPLINKTKADIVKLAIKLNVPLETTWSCYKGENKPCGVCDSCILRKKGFKSAGVEDPLLC